MESRLLVLAGIALALGGGWLWTRLMGFEAQSMDDYADLMPVLQSRDHLIGRLVCDGMIFGPNGRVTSRFHADMALTWDGPNGVMDEMFHYDDGTTRERQWRLTIGADGSVRAEADGVIGTGYGTVGGNALGLRYRIRLPQENGGHVLDAVDWMYLQRNGTILNRSRFRKFGVRVAELFRTMRPAPRKDSTCDWAGERSWLIGASEGLGAALAAKLSAAGAEPILSARSDDRLRQVAVGLPGRARVVPCDLSDARSVRAAAATVGEIDGLVVTAGVYWPQMAQDWNPREVEAMIDLVGTARPVGAVIGAIVVRNAGHVVLTGSLSGFRGLPGGTGYGATKAGIMGLAEGLHADLRGTGVTVRITDPGSIETLLTQRNDFAMPFLMSPEAAAQEMFELTCTDDFKRSFPMVFSWLFPGGQSLRDRLWHAIFGKRGRGSEREASLSRSPGYLRSKDGSAFPADDEARRFAWARRSAARRSSRSVARREPAPMSTSAETIRLTLDGQEVEAAPGMTIWEVTNGRGLVIPHLCHKPAPGYRPDGNCLACVVEGEPVLAASCIREPLPGMVVTSDSAQARSACRMVVEMLLADEPKGDVAHDRSSHLWDMADATGVAASRQPALDAGRIPPLDVNHVAMRVNLEACIPCELCVRACREVQVNDVIGVAGRGHDAYPVFDLDDPMGGSTWVACGECVQVCPTGALMPATMPDAAQVGDPADYEMDVKSIRPFCFVDCQVSLKVRGDQVFKVDGIDGPANAGRP